MAVSFHTMDESDFGASLKLLYISGNFLHMDLQFEVVCITRTVTFQSRIQIQRKMEPLITVKRVLFWVCIYPGDGRSSSMWKKMVRLLFPLMCLLIAVCGIAACGTFTLRYISTNLPDCVFSFLAVLVYSNSVCFMLNGFAQRHKITRMFRRLSEIVEASKSKRVKSIWTVSVPITMNWLIFISCRRESQFDSYFGRCQPYLWTDVATSL